MSQDFISYKNALSLTKRHTKRLGTEKIQLAQSIGYITVNDIYGVVDSPNVDTSLKDGFAIISHEIEKASADTPVSLKILGDSTAGNPTHHPVVPGSAVRILTGGKIPVGANAVVAEEFAQQDGQYVIVKRNAGPGRNILSAGSDLSKDSPLLLSQTLLTPNKTGLLAAAGYFEIDVFRKPRVAILATGDEVVAPGKTLAEGQLYASNLITLNAWCKKYGMKTSLDIVKDDKNFLSRALEVAVLNNDAVLTSGGAWTGDRDLMASTLAFLSWEKIYHRVKLGPGKGVGFGLLKKTPVFILPGGPSSNLVAFLMLALPGLLNMSGLTNESLPHKFCRLGKTLKGKKDWTQVFFGRLEKGVKEDFFYPIEKKSRLMSMALAEGIVSIPYGRERFPAGEIVLVRQLI